MKIRFVLIDDWRWDWRYDDLTGCGVIRPKILSLYIGRVGLRIERD